MSTIKIHPWHADCAKAVYKKFSNQVCFPIVNFLTGKDYQNMSEEAFKAKRTSMIAADGKKITSFDNVILANQLTEDEIKNITSEPDKQ